MSRSALILAGHGSHISPNTAGLVWDAVDVLRRLGDFDEVTAAFWKEMPSFATVMDGIVAPDVTVVPLFTAQGYFTRTVIPAEMGIDASSAHLRDSRSEQERRHGMSTRPNLKRIKLEDVRQDATQSSKSSTQTNLKRINMSSTEPSISTRRQETEQASTPRIVRYTRTLGEHPRIAEIVRRRVHDAVAAVKAPADDIAIALIGHATRRNPDSRKATEAQAMLVRSSTPVREVVAVYLDDLPAIPDVFRLTSAPVLIAVPYFLASGSHTTIDVPEALGIGAGATGGEANGRRIVYTEPIGQRDEIVEMALDLAREAGAPMRDLRVFREWEGFPRGGMSEAGHLLQHAPVQFGELWITRDFVRHAADSDYGLRAIDTASALRRLVRGEPFRPLATAIGLPSGWRVDIGDDVARLHAVIETIYPGVLGMSAHARQNGVSSGAWGAAIARQTGQYRALADLDLAGRADVIGRVCGSCVLRPDWSGDGGVAEPGLRIFPCREPCNVWLSAAIGSVKEEE